jgi:hypothetical protein
MASLGSSVPFVKKAALLLLCAVVGLLALGMSKKQPVTIRFFLQGNPHDTDIFSSPLHLDNPARDIFIEKIPAINERMIKAIYPFQAANGSWGCAFKLDESGRLALEVLSTERRNTIIIAMLSTKAHSRMVVNMLVDKPILDGIISIPYGLTELEVSVLTKEFPVIGQKKKKKK